MTRRRSSTPNPPKATPAVVLPPTRDGKLGYTLANQIARVHKDLMAQRMRERLRELRAYYEVPFKQLPPRVQKALRQRETLNNKLRDLSNVIAAAGFIDRHYNNSGLPTSLNRTGDISDHSRFRNLEHLLKRGEQKIDAEAVPVKAAVLGRLADEVQPILAELQARCEAITAEFITTLPDVPPSPDVAKGK